MPVHVVCDVDFFRLHSPVTILYEDDHILVVQKPAGRLAQPDRTGDVDVLTLGKQYLKNGGRDPFLGLVHRLDRPTSGVMVLARTSDAARCLSRQFRERTVQKQYIALVEGELRGIGHWSDYIAKPDRRPQVVSPDNPAGKRAALDWQVLQPLDRRTLLLVDLRTGRPHQIRLQAAERGHPVVGDVRYGASEAWEKGTIALHHAVLRLEHPEMSRGETFVANVPGSWRENLSDRGNAAVNRVLSQARPAE